MTFLVLKIVIFNDANELQLENMEDISMTFSVLKFLKFNDLKELQL